MTDATENKDRIELWRHPTSDALARLKAIGAYFYSAKQKTQLGNDKQLNAELMKFCERHELHRPTLDRALELSKQLRKIYSVVFSGSEDDADAEFHLLPPTKDQEVALRQVLLTGLPDCIARRAKVGVISSGSRRSRLTGLVQFTPHLLS